MNGLYLLYLKKYPLLTKSVTAGVLAALNESIASLVTRDLKTKTITVKTKQYSIKHVFSPKILTMIVYGSLIVTPITHNMYAALNKIFKGPNLSKAMKLLQIATSLCTVTPLVSAIYVSWLSIINDYDFFKLFRGKSVDWNENFQEIKSIVINGLKKNYFAVVRTSAMTSVVTLAFAQNFLKPEMWVVFFNFVYFVLGTIQNIRVKRSQKQSKSVDHPK